jgi:3-hydroxyisobutyrate dehydrogenase-like beta-hydroxyacid dehydrogenase
MRVGFIGLGTMGTPIVLNLLKSGFKVKVNSAHLNSDNVKLAVKHGAVVAETPKEAAIGSDVVMFSLPSPEVSENVSMGKNGVLDGASAGTIIIELSTVPPSTVKKIGKAAKKKGVDVLDAPVSGGRKGAELGTLTIMVGGKKEVFDKCLPIFKAIGKRIYYVGELGSGEAVKLINSLIAITNLIVAREGIKIAVNAGINLKLLHKIVDASTGQSWIWSNWIPLFIKKEKANSKIDISYKDLTSAISMAKELGVDVVVSSKALDLIKYYKKKGLGKSDILTLFDFLPNF